MMIKKVANTMTALLVLVLWGCSQPEEPKVKIAINPWPGYEFLFLAQEKGFFKEENLNIELIELPSLADVQRVYVQGRADGLASTMIEVVQAAGLTQEAISVVLIPDYSNGGDVIVASTTIPTLADLKGKRVGAEIGSLGMYILAQALKKEGLSLDDVDIINVEQLKAEESFNNNEIDAVVTYPPYSTNIMKNNKYHQIFDTSVIPKDIIDTVSFRSSVLKSLPTDWLERFNKSWDKALAYSTKHTEEAHTIMATREGISPSEFSDALSGLELLNSRESLAALQSDQTQSNAKTVCSTLSHAQSITFKCETALANISFEK